MHLNLQTFTPTITIKCCGKLKELLIVKISVFCWKSEWDCGWDAPCAQEGKICAPAHTKGRSWRWGTHNLQGWMEPTVWFAVTELCREYVPGWCLTCACWWHLPGCRRGSSHSGEMQFSCAHEVNCFLWAVCQSTGMACPNFRKCLFHY